MPAGRKPPNGKTLALLCLKFVKHRDQAKIRQKIAQAIEEADEKCRPAPVPGLAFAAPPAKVAPNRRP
jgi:hypothetical protein